MKLKEVRQAIAAISVLGAEKLQHILVGGERQRWFHFVDFCKEQRQRHETVGCNVEDEFVVAGDVLRAQI